MFVDAILSAKGRHVFTVDPTVDLRSVVELLEIHHIGALVVCSRDGDILGLVSERDVLRSMARFGEGVFAKTAMDVMCSDFETCSPADSIDQLMTLMTEHRTRHVPVIDKGVLAGIVSIGDVVKHQIDDTRREVAVLQDYMFYSR